MNFDRVASLYRWAEYLSFGPALERRRFEYLAEAAAAQRVLILGDGDGRFTAGLLKRNQSIIADSVDLSAQMLRLAAARVKHAAPKACINFIQGDARTIELPHRYDLIVTHFFLDCFTTAELSELIPRISLSAAPHARWIVSEFQIPAKGWRRFLAAAIVQSLYLCFRFAAGLTATALPDHAAIMRANGYRLSAAKTANLGLLVSQLWTRAA